MRNFIILFIILISLGGCEEMTFKNQKEARVYLLDGINKKYGKEFEIVDKEQYQTIGVIDVFTCVVAPVDARDETAKARVTQYGDATDDYAGYYFKDESEQLCIDVCKQKDYLLGYEAFLQAPGVRKVWDDSNTLQEYLAESGAYVEVRVVMKDGLSNEEYGRLITDLLNSIAQLECYVDVRVRTEAQASNELIFFYKTSSDLQDMPSDERILEMMESEASFIRLREKAQKEKEAAQETESQ